MQSALEPLDRVEQLFGFGGAQAAGVFQQEPATARRLHDGRLDALEVVGIDACRQGRRRVRQKFSPKKSDEKRRGCGSNA